MNDYEWLTPELVKRARKLKGGRRVLARELHLTEHKARILADVASGKIEMPTARPDTILPAETRVVVPEHKDGRYKVGIVSDTHFGSDQQQPRMLDQMYDAFEREGVRQVYHAGDLLTGIDVYRGQAQEIFLHTMDEQVDYAIERYPRRDGIKTSIIAGNHDLSCTLRGGLDPLRAVAAARDDITYLGPLSAWVYFGPLSLYLLHPKGGLAYAVSYKLQKLIESFEGGRKPNVVVCGHWHKQAFVIERHVFGILPGCFEAQTTFERGLMLQPQLGGVVLDIEVREEEIAYTVSPKWMHFFVPRDKDR